MQQWTISQLDCDMQYKVDFIQEPAMINSVVGLRSSKALLKAKLAPKGHRHCLLVCCLFDPRQLSESQQNHHIWEACSANQWDAPKAAIPAAGIGQQKRANSYTGQHSTVCPTTNASKVEHIGLEVLPHLAYSPDLSPTDYYFKHLDNFLQGKSFHNQQEA